MESNDSPEISQDGEGGGGHRTKTYPAFLRGRRTPETQFERDIKGNSKEQTWPLGFILHIIYNCLYHEDLSGA